jgi:hypothetical protein
MSYPAAAAIRAGDQPGLLISALIGLGIATRAHKADAAGMSTGFTQHHAPSLTT